MIRLTLMLLLLLAAPFGDVAAAAKGKAAKEPPAPKFLYGHVVRVVDGDTLMLDGDRRIRLLDINTPELSHEGVAAEPYAREAASYLEQLAGGRDVRVEIGRKEKDPYGRYLGQVYIANGTAKGGWVNGTLVRDGYAHVYTFADNAMYADDLLALESQARAARRGLWVLDRWTVRRAGDCCGKADIGTFKLVQGRVLAAVKVKTSGGTRTYLNFGTDWKTDFSVFIADKDARWFKQAGITDIAEHYRGREVRVRGYLQPVNGVLVRVTHPAQIEILN